MQIPRGYAKEIAEQLKKFDHRWGWNDLEGKILFRGTTPAHEYIKPCYYGTDNRTITYGDAYEVLVHHYKEMWNTGSLIEKVQNRCGWMRTQQTLIEEYSKYLKMSMDEDSPGIWVCVHCSEPVRAMNIMCAVSVDLQCGDFYPDQTSWQDEGWETAGIHLQCSCGATIPHNMFSFEWVEDGVWILKMFIGGDHFEMMIKGGI